jgi:uncharacterized protein (DUF1919 family)
MLEVELASEQHPDYDIDSFRVKCGDIYIFFSHVSSYDEGKNIGRDDANCIRRRLRSLMNL